MTKPKFRWYSHHMTYTMHLFRIFSTYLLTMSLLVSLRLVIITNAGICNYWVHQWTWTGFHTLPPHENFVIVPADKASNNYTFVCRKYYVSILIEELGLNLLPGNPTYNLTEFSASEVLDNRKSVITSFETDPNEDELDLPYIYWIPKMHKNPYKHRFIAGSARCSNKPLSILLTKRKRKRSDSVLWQKPLHQQKCQKGKVTTQTTPQKSSIKQRLRTDLGRSVGVTTATQLVWLTGLRAHLPTNRNSRLIKRTHV